MFRMRDSFLWQLTLTVLLAWAAGMAALWFIVPDVIASDARKNVEFAATNTINQIKKFRNYYTQNVVRKVLIDGNLTPSATHQKSDRSIPLPATLIHDLGGLTEEDDISLSYYSPFPFANRRDRVLDEFQSAAWQFLIKNPDAVFSRQEVRAGRPTVRVATADRMVAPACVDCHNSHADSPRSDWRLGDVRGIIEVATHVDTQVATGATLSNTIMAWVSTAAAAILIFIIWTTRRVSRPLLTLTDILGQVSGGATDIDVPHRERRDEVGRLARGVQDFKDSVSEQKLRELDVLKAKEAAEVANAAKSRFLASASHDLRQPLQALNLFLSALGYTDDEEKRQEIVERLKSSVSVLGTLLNALLDISNLEAGTISPKREVFKVDQLFGLADEFRPLAQAKGIELIAVPTSAASYSDPALLESVVRNLLANAIKYTERGRILLGCRRTGDQLRIEVWDTGMGIPQSDLGLVFEEFYQIGNQSRDRDQGLGLGLSIVQRTASLLNHKIGVSSEVGKGSVFSIEVPLRKPSDVQVRSTALMDAGLKAGQLVVIIDDDPAVLSGMQTLLESLDCIVVSSDYGGDPREENRLIQKTCDRVPDVIIADYRLPGSDNGIDVIVNLRRLFDRAIPAILLTGEMNIQDISVAEAPNVEIVHKPVQLEELQAAVRRLTDKLSVDSV